jgi:hypothetical protein
MAETSVKNQKAQYARKKYDENKDTEQRRKLIYRIQKGKIPTVNSLKKHGLTLDEVNEIRKNNKLPRIESDKLLGFAKEKYSMKLKSPEAVIRSIIPNVHVFEKHTEEQVKVSKIDKDSLITLDVYFECISEKLVPNTIKMYRRYIKQILTTMGWKEDESIVPYLKKYKDVEKVISNLKQTRGSDKGKPY